MRITCFGIALICALGLLTIGCGTSTQNQRMPIPEVTSSSSAPSTSQSASSTSIPATADIDARRLTPLRAVFEEEPQRLDDLYPRLRGKVTNLMIVSGCDLEVLKVFIAKDWAPIVLLAESGNRKTLWAVAGYDQTQRIYLENPSNGSEKRPTIDDFEDQWGASGSAGKCILVTPQQLNDLKFKSILTDYLSSAKASQVTFRSPYK